MVLTAKEIGRLDLLTWLLLVEDVDSGFQRMKILRRIARDQDDTELQRLVLFLPRKGDLPVKPALLKVYAGFVANCAPFPVCGLGPISPVDH
jgi:hypothetical protein